MNLDFLLQPINGAIFILWFLSALFDYADFVYLWQLKEYRMDRFFDFLHTRQGKHFWLRANSMWRIPLLALAIFWPVNNALLFKEILAIVLAADIGIGFFRYIKKQFRRPVWTAKALAIILLALLLEGGVILASRDWSFFAIFLVLRFFLVSGIIYLFSYPTQWIKDWYIFLAAKKLKRFPKLIVIGITGSYGKSSVKECLAHMLAERYHVIKTPKNINTEIGIAKYILKTDFQNTEVFVVEMGAYTKGEIQLIANMVHPNIGILTTIAEQHLALFGSIQNIQQAKYELLRALPKDGYAVTNMDNPYCTALLQTLACEKKETFGKEEANRPAALIEDMETVEKGIAFSISMDGKKEHIEASVIGEHHALNIAPAIMAARYLDVPWKEIQARCRTLPADVQGSIRVYAYGTATVIDDSYNSNPAGFRAALDILNTYPSQRKRVVITRGMLELGEASDRKHEEIGGEIAFVADELILISRDFEAPLRRGVVDKYKTEIKVIDDTDELLSYIRLLKNTDVVILLENRISSLVYKEITA